MSYFLNLIGGLSLESFLLLAFLCFLASAIDAIAGGGGLISLPAYMAAGLPPHTALGTNKISATLATIASALNFLRSKKIILPLVYRLAPLAFIGAYFGVKTALLIPAQYFQPISFILLLGVFFYTLFNKNMGEEYCYETPKKETIVVTSILALCIGFYDGFLGPGTGSFIIFVLIRFFHLDFSHATATTKIINLSSNIMSVTMYFLAQKVNVLLGLSIAVIMIIGALVGSSLAIYKGSKFIKPIFLTVTIITILKMGYSFLHTVL